MFKSRNSTTAHKTGMTLPSPRSRGGANTQDRLTLKLIIFFITLALFTLAVRLVSPPPTINPWTPREEVNHYDHAAPEVQHLAHPLPTRNRDVPTTVSQLIAKIKAKTELASKTAPEFTASMRSAWETDHPCRSRGEIRALYSLRKVTKDAVDNLRWKEVYGEYEKLHRACVTQMGNVTEFFLGRKRIEGCQFVVAGVEPGAGLGNKVLSVAAAMVYAVVTGRVLLVPGETAVPGVFCEPFAGSSWEVDPDGVSFLET